MAAVILLWSLLAARWSYCSTAVPVYKLGLLLPTVEEVEAMEPSGALQINIRRAMILAIRDANAQFGKHFRLSFDYLVASTHHNQTSADVLKWLSTTNMPPVALVGPFHVEHVKTLSPLAHLLNMPLVSPTVERSQMANYVLSDSTFLVSLYPETQTGGIELFPFIKSFNWSTIAVIVTKSASVTTPSRYEDNVASILSDSLIYEVTVLEVVRIPQRSQFVNDTNTFEKEIRNGLDKIVNSGITVIVLSLEPEPMTYQALFRIANDVGLIGASFAWISLRFPIPQQTDDYHWFPKIYQNASEFMEGLVDIQPNQKSAIDVAPKSVTLQDLSLNYKGLLDFHPAYQLVYDTVWMIGFAIEEMITNGIYPSMNVSVLDRLPDIPIFRWNTGKQLINAISKQTFKGLSGLVDLLPHTKNTSAGYRLPRMTLRNIRKNKRYNYYQVREAGSYNLDGQEPVYDAYLYWHAHNTRSPQGIVNICKHSLNVLIPGPNYYEYFKTSPYYGWAVDLFKEAAESQCLTNYKFFSFPNMTWDEAISLIGEETNVQYPYQSSLTFHVAIAPFGETAERSTKVQFSRPIKAVAYRLAIRKPSKAKPSLWQFIQPFSWQLWLTVVAFLLFSGILLFVLEKKRKRFPDSSPDLADSIFVSISAIFYTQDQDSILSQSGKGFIAIVCFVSLILCACFTANLTVFFLEHHSETTYRTIHDLRNQVIGAPKVTGALTYMKKTYAHDLNITFVDAPPGTGLELLKSNIIEGFLDDSAALENYVRSDCEVQLLDDNIFTVNAAFALKRGSVFNDKLNNGIIHVWGKNFIEQLDQRHFEWPDQCQNYKEPTGNESLTLQHLGGLFVIFAAAAVLCLLGDLTRCYLYKKGILRYNLDSEPTGVHATARGIKSMVETAADISMAGSLAGSTWSLSGHGLYQKETSTDNKTRWIRSRKTQTTHNTEGPGSSTWSLPNNALSRKNQIVLDDKHSLQPKQFLSIPTPIDKRAPLPPMESQAQG